MKIKMIIDTLRKPCHRESFIIQDDSVIMLLIVTTYLEGVIKTENRKTKFFSRPFKI